MIPDGLVRREDRALYPFVVLRVPAKSRRRTNVRAWLSSRMRRCRPLRDPPWAGTIRRAPSQLACPSPSLARRNGFQHGSFVTYACGVSGWRHRNRACPAPWLTGLEQPTRRSWPRYPGRGPHQAQNPVLPESRVSYIHSRASLHRLVLLEETQTPDPNPNPNYHHRTYPKWRNGAANTPQACPTPFRH